MFRKEYERHFKVLNNTDHSVLVETTKGTQWSFVQNPGLACWMIKKMGPGSVATALEGGFKTLDLAARTLFLYYCRLEEGDQKIQALKEQKREAEEALKAVKDISAASAAKAGKHAAA